MSQRARRVAELIKQEVSQLLQRGLKDPRIGFVTVTDVEVTGDLRNAKIFISVYGNEEQKQASMKGLKAATGFVRKEVGKHLRLRHTPEMAFYFDHSVEYGAKINTLLEDIKRNERLVEADDEEDEHTEGDC